MLTYAANEARFTECLTGRDYPLVEDGDYEALEHAYLAAGAEAGGPIMASFDGGIVQVPEADGDGHRAEVLVERFVGVWPGETCERALGAAQPHQHLLEDPAARRRPRSPPARGGASRT